MLRFRGAQKGHRIGTRRSGHATTAIQIWVLAQPKYSNTDTTCCDRIPTRSVSSLRGDSGSSSMASRRARFSPLAVAACHDHTETGPS